MATSNQKGIAARFKSPSVLPGFGPTMGFTLFYLSLVVLLPFVALVLKTTSLTWEQFWQTATAPRVLASYELTFTASLIGAVINAVMGFIVAWVLVRYAFPGKRLLDAMVDLPFALPTAVPPTLRVRSLQRPLTWFWPSAEN